MIQTLDDIKRLFNYSVVWNGLEAFVYQTLFLLHYGFLFYVIGAQQSGIFSTGISVLYAWLMIGNLGFDYTLAPFFLYITSNRADYFWHRWILQLCIIGMSCSIFYFCFFYIMPEQFSHIGLLPICMAILLFSESIKKSMRIVLQLALKNKTTATIEIATIASYMLIVWTYYYFYRHITLTLLVIPLCITSIISSCLLCLFAYLWSKSLPITHQPFNEVNVGKRIFKSRFYATLYIITQQLFSSNILIPAIAYSSGMRQAGIFTMVSTIVYSITHLFYKISASSTITAFAWAKRQTIAFKQEMFSLVWSELSKIASIASLILIVNQLHITTNSFSISPNIIMQGYAYVGILIIEFFTVAYEKFYLNEEKADRLLFLQLLVILSGGMILLYGKLLNTTLILELLFVLRAISFIFIMIQSFRVWNLKPEWRTPTRRMLYGIPLVIALYLTIKILIKSLF